LETLMAHLLVATPDTSLGLLLQAELGAAGHDVEWAMDGREALDLAVEQQPPLIFLDTTLDWITTPEVCRALQHEPFEVAIVLLSREPVDGHALHAMGAVEWLAKSHILEDVRELLSRHLATD
jgi:CheY-like chemotaxis protein